MPPTRIGHKKSRFGCVRCKQRHVKCDEQRPCGNCVRHQVECSLILSTLSLAASAHNSPARLPGPAGDYNDGTRFQHIHSASVTPNNQLAHSPAAFPTPDQTSNAHSQQSNPISPNPRASSIRSKVSSIRQALLELTDEVDVLERNQSNEAPQALPQPAEESRPNPPANSISTADWLGDIQLFNHYMSTDCLGLTEYHRGEMWREVIPQLAFTREPLMHGILALSALHLASLHPDRKREYTAQSARHQEVALSRLRTGLSDTTEENCFEHFILAYLVILFNFYSIGNPIIDVDENEGPTSSSPSSPSDSDNNNNRRRPHPAPLDMHELGQTIFLGQGIMTMISSPQTWSWMRRGPLSDLFATRHPNPVPTTAATLPPSSPPPSAADPSSPGGGASFPRRLAQLSALVSAVSGSPRAPAARASCLLALDALRRVYGAVVLAPGRGRKEATPVWMWLTLLPADFRDWVARGHPAALVLLAHYAALVGCFEDRWYLRGWSARVLVAVERVFRRRGGVGEGDWGEGGERWLEWLEFPKAFGVGDLDEAIREGGERRERERERGEGEGRGRGGDGRRVAA